eukprot:COSAG01_NODE_3_length_63519_cov_1591.007663_8_plen_171_part_00
MTNFQNLLKSEQLDTNLKEKLSILLEKETQDIAVAENNSEGILMQALCDINKDRIKSGILCNTEASIVQLLGIAPKVILKKNNYKNRSLIMAQKIRERCFSDIGIATTGYETNTIKEMHVSISTRTYQRSKKYTLDKKNKKNKTIKKNIEDATLGTLYFYLSSRQEEVLT